MLKYTRLFKNQLHQDAIYYKNGQGQKLIPNFRYKQLAAGKFGYLCK